jgi:hypothetical protein
MSRMVSTWMVAPVMAAAFLSSPSILVRAEGPKAATRLSCLIVPQDKSVEVRASSKKKIAIANCKDECARVAVVVGDPSAILVTGVEPGVARLDLTDEDKKVDQVVVYVVPPKTVESGNASAIVLTKDESVVATSASKKKIKKTDGIDDKIVQLKVDAKDSSKFEIKGLAKGASLIALTDEDGKKERLLVVVGE